MSDAFPLKRLSTRYMIGSVLSAMYRKSSISEVMLYISINAFTVYEDIHKDRDLSISILSSDYRSILIAIDKRYSYQ